jgi:hypothetical protein
VPAALGRAAAAAASADDRRREASRQQAPRGTLTARHRDRRSHRHANLPLTTPSRPE